MKLPRRHLYLMAGLFLLVTAVGLYFLYPESPPEIEIAKDVKLQIDGQPASEKITVVAAHPVSIHVDFLPNEIDESLFERHVHDPDRWRFRARFTNESGSPVPMDKQAMPIAGSEFQTYDMMLWIQKDGKDNIPGVPHSAVWISPDPPAKIDTARQYRWHALTMPKLPGNYHLEIMAYPTADPYHDSIYDYELGFGFKIAQCDLTVMEGPESPIDKNCVITLRRVTPKERAVMKKLAHLQGKAPLR